MTKFKHEIDGESYLQNKELTLVDRAFIKKIKETIKIIDSINYRWVMEFNRVYDKRVTYNNDAKLYK